MSGFSQPPAACTKTSKADMCKMMKHHPQKDGCCNKNKHDAGGSFCNFCVLCVAFIIPLKPGVQRNFVSAVAAYPDMVQSKLTDYSPSCWRPPNA
jgi:hypothetical protein